MPNKSDMRYIRTERAIRSAFIEAVSEEQSNTLTVSDLCHKAGISRNAFYLHYSSVSSLYGSLIAEIVDDVSEECASSSRRMVATGKVDETLASAIVHALSRHEALLRALLPSDNGTLAKRLAEGMEQAYVSAALLISEQGDSFEHRMSCAFAAWAHVGILVRWIGETDRPLGKSLELFTKLQAGITESAARYLMA